MLRTILYHGLVSWCALLAVNVLAGQTVPLHRIGINAARPSEFVDTATGKAFFPEGNNYVSRVINRVACDFNVGLYDPAKAEATLAQMQHDGYTVVRIFVQFETCQTASGTYGGIGWTADAPGLSPAYVGNLVDFLRRATAHRLYVLPVLTFVPYTTYYQTLLNASSGIGGVNRFYLGSGGIEAKKEYVRQFVTAIAGLDPSLLTTIFSYELENEVEIDGNQPPFKSASGAVRTADGVTYDMSSDASRQQCMDANLVFWANSVAAAVRERDPQALVAASVFTYAAVGKSGPNGVRIPPGGNCRFPARPLVWSVWARGLSYVDIHAYPSGSAYRLDADLASSEFLSIPKTQPFLMGEFGAADTVYPTVYAAAGALQQHREQAYQRGFTGALLWTWDWARGIDNPNYPASEANGAINGALAPVTRVTASRSASSTYPYLVADGLTATSWVSGGFAPQWVQLDMGRTRAISRITLVVEQSPGGDTRHVITGGTTPGSMSQLGVIERTTQAGQTLTLNISRQNLRYLRITTTKSPSWIAWKEISVE